MPDAATTTYDPRPGTVAYRALAHLATLEHGAEISGPRLSELLGIESATLRACMQPAVAAGKVFARQKDRTYQRAPMFWSLVDHDANRPTTPPPGPQTPINKPAPVELRPAPAARDVLDDTPLMSSKQRLILRGATKPDCFRAALWTNGVLQIERGDEVLPLTPEQTQAVRGLLVGAPS